LNGPLTRLDTEYIIDFWRKITFSGQLEAFST
jgi:hypothetical protein